MAVHPGWFDLDRRYRALSAVGDPLERLALVIDFEQFRDELDAAWCARIGPRAAARPATRC
jgi:transposase, IS5 family